MVLEQEYIVIEIDMSYKPKIPALIGRKAGNTLDRPPVHHRAHMHSELGVQFSISSPPDCMSLDCGRKTVRLEETHPQTG